MKLAIIGNFGSGKTTKLKELSRKYGMKYLSHYDLKGVLYNSKPKEFHIMNRILRDYVAYIIYKRKMYQYYRSYTEFLNDLSELFMFILNTPLWFEDIQTSNKVFNEFFKTYNKISDILMRNGIVDNYNYLKVLLKEKVSSQIEDNIAIDDIDMLYFKEAQVALQLQNIIMAITNKEFLEKINTNIDKIITLEKRTRKNTIESKKVENKYIFIKDHLNTPEIAFIISKRDRIIIEKYINKNTNKSIIDLLNYIIHQKYKTKKIEVQESTPSLYLKMEKINKVLNEEENIIYEFLNVYERIKFESIDNVFTSPYNLVNRYYKIIYIDKKYYTQSKVKEIKNKLFPYDFFTPSSLLYEFEDKYDLKEFLSSKADKIVFFEESEPQKVKETSEIENHKEIIELKEKDLDAISYSQIALYNTCPYRYKLRYIYGLEEDIKPHFIFGNIIHKVLELVFKENISLQEIEKIFIEKIRSQSYVLKDTYEFYLKRGMKILKNFIKREKESFKGAITLEVEYPVRMRIGNKEFVGIIDRIIKKDGEIYLIDYKTSRANNEKETIKSAEKQLSLYAYLLKMQNISPKKGYIWLLSQDKIIEINLKDSLIEKEIKNIKEVIEKINRKEFHPKPSPYTCKSCSFRMICKYWRYQ